MRDLAASDSACPAPRGSVASSLRRTPNLLRFALWNLGVRVCDLDGGALNRFAVWFEERTGRESRIYGCMIHPTWLLPKDELLPSAWWDRFGWRKP